MKIINKSKMSSQVLKSCISKVMKHFPSHVCGLPLEDIIEDIIFTEHSFRNSKRYYQTRRVKIGWVTFGKNSNNNINMLIPARRRKDQSSEYWAHVIIAVIAHEIKHIIDKETLKVHDFFGGDMLTEEQFHVLEVNAKREAKKVWRAFPKAQKRIIIKEVEKKILLF